MSKGLYRHFSKEHIEMADRYMKRSSTSIIFREMQIKTAMEYHLTLVRMAIIKKKRDMGVWVAQLVKHLTLDLSSGLDLRVVSSSPSLGSTLGMEPTQKQKQKQKQNKKSKNKNKNKNKKLTT